MPIYKNKKLTIIIPYRDRKAHLKKFIKHMKFFLAGINYEVIVIEQANKKLFNRAKLFNVGFDLTKSQNNYFCFHDVDILPENRLCDYKYPLRPTHLAFFCSQFDYKLPYGGLFGGVVLFNQKDFEKINGYSNEYYGWGGEDDDLLNRIKYFKLTYTHKRGRYRSLPHKAMGIVAIRKKAFYKKNLKKLLGRYDFRKDGLSNLKYHILKKENFKDYTKYLADI